MQALGQKKVSELQKKKNPPLYHAKKEFEELVGAEFNELLNKILKECNYRAGYASWHFKTFDILMDGVSKEEDQGKGYRSFLSSVIALMLYEYFNSDDDLLNRVKGDRMKLSYKKLWVKLGYYVCVQANAWL